MDNEAACLKNFGRWLTITKYDAGKNGWEGNALHLLDADLKNMYTWTLKSGKEHKENLCLDYFGDEFSECYTLVMDAEGLHPEEVSWKLSVKTKKDNGIREATQEGGAPDEARLMWYVGRENFLCTQFMLTICIRKPPAPVRKSSHVFLPCIL